MSKSLLFLYIYDNCFGDTFNYIYMLAWKTHEVPRFFAYIYIYSAKINSVLWPNDKCSPRPSPNVCYKCGEWENGAIRDTIICYIALYDDALGTHLMSASLLFQFDCRAYTLVSDDEPRAHTNIASAKCRFSVCQHHIYNLKTIVLKALMTQQTMRCAIIYPSEWRGAHHICYM